MKSYKDIALVFLTEGIAGVETCRAEGVSDDVIVKAFESLQASGSDTDVGEFEQFIGQNIELTNGAGRGRPAPVLGASRIYKAQRVGETGAFIRLPVELLGCTKGEGVKVSFENGRMIVEKAEVVGEKPAVAEAGETV